MAKVLTICLFLITSCASTPNVPNDGDSLCFSISKDKRCGFYSWNKSEFIAWSNALEECHERCTQNCSVECYKWSKNKRIYFNIR